MKIAEILFEETRKLPVTRETYDMVEIGKSYNFGGKVAKVLDKLGQREGDDRVFFLSVENKEPVEQSYEEKRAAYAEAAKKSAERRLQRAIDAINSGFSSEAARKDALSDLNYAYEYTLRDKAAYADNAPFSLSQIREKHFPIFQKLGLLDDLKLLLKYREELKSMPLGPRASEVKKSELAKKLAANTVIADATKPLKDKAVEQTREEAELRVEKTKRFLEKHDFDPYKAVPKVEIVGKYGTYEYNASKDQAKTADKKRSYYLAFIDKRNNNYIWSEVLAKHFIEMCVKATEDHYDSWVAKMNQKIKNPTAAKFEWLDDVWRNSLLLVKTPEGTESWKTQRILNYSKYGKVFNQFPSRRVK